MDNMDGFAVEEIKLFENVEFEEVTNSAFLGFESCCNKNTQKELD